MISRALSGTVSQSILVIAIKISFWINIEFIKRAYGSRIIHKLFCYILNFKSIIITDQSRYVNPRSAASLRNPQYPFSSRSKE